jgi:transketolase
MGLAANIRADCLRMCHEAQAPHIASCLSCADILAVLFGRVLKDDDGFILSKAHAACAYYATIERLGCVVPMWFPEEHSDVLDTTMRQYAGGSTGYQGSLGHGLAVACGMALAGRRVFVLMGDGECDEGTVWEAAAIAADNHLPIVAITDANGWQAMRRSMAPDQIANIFAAFRWTVYTCDGHDEGAIEQHLSWPHAGPLALICRTVKGKGVLDMEDDNQWHYRPPEACHV